MKRIAIALIILFVTAVSCIFTLINFENAISEMITLSDEMAKSVEADDRAAARSALEQLDASWQQHQNFFRILSGGEPCEQLDRSITQVRVWFEQKDKSPETLSELYNLIKKAEDLRKTQTPSVINLF